MSLLAGVHYDPATAVAKATTALLALTAVDTTNLRVTFTAPPSGNVLVRLRCAVEGNATSPNLLFGVLEGATVVGRQCPLASAVASATSSRNVLEAMFVVTGLTAGSTHTYDAAYAVQLVQTTSNIQYGGPNDTTTDNAWGGFAFEIWDAANLLAGELYDPGTLVTKALSAATALAAFDTTNLRLTVTAPGSGNILAKVRCGALGAANPFGQPLFGVLEGATVVARAAPNGGRTNLSANAAGVYHCYESEMLITGLTAGSSHTYDAAWGNEVAGTAGSQLQYGGPNDAAGADAQGGIAFELWAA